MLDFLKSALFCIALFAYLAAAYGIGIDSKSLVLNSLMLALPCSIVLTLFAYLTWNK